MICPNCKRKYKDGTVLCPKCHVTLKQGDEPRTSEFIQENTGEDPKLALVFQTWNSYEFLDACKTLKDEGVEFKGDESYSGEIHIDGRGRGQAPYIWNIYVPIEQKENALSLLTGIMDANAGYADAGMKPLKPGERKIFWIFTAIVALIWAIIIWKLNF